MCSEKITEFNKAIERAKEVSCGFLLFGKLGDTSFCLKVFADAAFACNDDLSSQIVYTITLCDSSGKSHMLTIQARRLSTL